MNNRLRAVIFDMSGIPEAEKGFIIRLINELKKEEIESFIFNEYGKAEVAEKTVEEKLNLILEKFLFKADSLLITVSSENTEKAVVKSGIPMIGFNGKYKPGFEIGFVIEGFEEVSADFMIKAWKRINRLPILITESKRLLIKEFSYENIESVIDIMEEPHIIKYIPDGRDNRALRKEKLVSYIENVYKFYDFGMWGVFLKETEELIGSVSIDLKETTGKPEYELGFFVKKDFLGKGYMKEAVILVTEYAHKISGIKKLISITSTKNREAIRLLLKTGFIKIGIKDGMYIFENNFRF